MKKIMLFAALVLAAAVSCTKEVAPEEKISLDVVPEGYVPLTLSARIDADTKTIIASKMLLWEVDDEVAVFADGAGSALKFKVTDCYTVGSFVGVKINGSVPAGAKTFTVVYPYSAAVKCANGVATVKIPAEQVIPEGKTYDPAAFPVVGYYASAEGLPTFRNVVSFVKFNVGKSTGVKKVELSLDGTVFSAGEIEVTPDGEDGVPAIASKCDAFTTVTSAQGFVPEKDYIVTVAPASSKVIAARASTDSKAAMRVSENPIVLERNNGKNLGDITADAAWRYFSISNAAELGEFLAEADTYPAGWEVKLKNDIDCTDVELPTAKSFAGIFDGQDYSLKNWTANGTALFALNTGTVENFVIDKSCNLIPPATATGAVAFVACQSKGLVSGIVNNADITADINFGGGRIAIIVGQCDAANSEQFPDLADRGITVTKCVNNGNVTLNTVANTTGTQYVGTIVGSMGNSTQNMLSDCVNNGSLTINCSGENTYNFYIGGVAGGTTNGSNNVNITNNGDVTFNAAGHEAALCLAGISSYSTGVFDNCINKGKITFNSGRRLKATFVSGIAGYFASNKMMNTINYGDVTVVAGAIGGRNGIGDINKKTYNGKEAITSGLTAGGLVSATGRNPEFEDCSNYGKVSVTLNDPANNPGTHTAARPSVGGLVGDCSGPMLNCDNYGDVEVILDNGGTEFTPTNAGYSFYVGGIVGSGYNFSGPTTASGSDKDKLNKFTLENCDNHGNVYYKSDSNHANTFNAIGGVCGWPGTEGSSTPYTAKNCTNSGNVTADVHVKIRVGGVHGGLGRMENCSNTGDVTIVNANPAAVIGGLTGFHSQNFPATGCSTSGKVEAKVQVDAMGGLIGNIGNVTTANIYGCNVDAQLIGTPNCPEGRTGMIVGTFNGNKDIAFGTEEAPIVISGSVDGVPISADNLATYFCGLGTFDVEHHSAVCSLGGVLYTFPQPE